MRLVLHHVGLVVSSIEAYLRHSIWERSSEVVEDPAQRARLCLLAVPGRPIPPAVELVEPLGEHSPVWKASQRSAGWHHVCLAAPACAVADDFAAGRAMLPVTPWQPAVLFDGRPVRFYYSRNRELIEFLADDRVC
jgi:hypothetical protein